MIADVILGVNVDTKEWIKNIEIQLSEHIIVLDYNYTGEIVFIDRVTYLSPFNFKEYIKKFDSINYYKSIYILPGTFLRKK